MTASLVCARDINSLLPTFSPGGVDRSFAGAYDPPNTELSAPAATSVAPPGADMQREDLLGNGKFVQAKFGGMKIVIRFEDSSRNLLLQSSRDASEQAELLVSVDWKTNAGEREERLKWRYQPGRALKAAFLEAARANTGEKMADFSRRMLEEHGHKVRAVTSGCLAFTFSSSDPDFQEKVREPQTLDKIKRDVVELFFPAEARENLLSSTRLQVLSEPLHRSPSGSVSDDSGTFAPSRPDDADTTDLDDDSDDDSDDEGEVQPGERRDVLGNGRFVQIGLMNTVIVVEFTEEALQYREEHGADVSGPELLRLVNIHWKKDERNEGLVRLKVYVDKKQDKFAQKVLKKLRGNRAERLAKFVEREYEDLRAQLTGITTGCLTLEYSSSAPNFRETMEQNVRKIKRDFLEILGLDVHPGTVVMEVTPLPPDTASSAPAGARGLLQGSSPYRHSSASASRPHTVPATPGAGSSPVPVIRYHYSQRGTMVRVRR